MSDIERAEVYSELTGVITMMYVEDGADVKFGERLMGVEAMKMIHDLYAPFDGKFVCNASLGQVVGENEVVAFIEVEV